MTNVAEVGINMPWFQLLERVMKGEYITITQRGVAVAKLTPITPQKPSDIHKAIAKLKEFQASHTLGGLKTRELIEEGRRY
jgi:prevent-host-death family protein